MTTLRIFIPSQWHHKSSLELLTYEWVLFDAMGYVLRQGIDLINTLPIANSIEVVIPAEWTTLVQVTLPKGQQKRVLDALPYLIEDHLITSPEQVHVVIAELLGNQRAMLASIEKSLLQHLLECMLAANLVVSRVLPATLVPKLVENHWSIVSDEDHLFVRTKNADGFVMEWESAEEAPLALVLALQQSNQEGNMPNAIDLYGKKLPEIAAWSKQLGLPCLAQSANWKAYPPQMSMNLLQGIFSPPNQTWAWIKHAKPALFALIGIVLIEVLGVCIDWGMKVHQVNTLDAQMEALFRATFPEASTVVDPPLQMQRKLAEIQHASGNLDSADFLSMLANVSSKTGGLDGLSHLDFQTGEITFTLQVASEEAGQALLQKLTASGLNIALTDHNNNQNGVQIKLVVKAKDQHE